MEAVRGRGQGIRETLWRVHCVSFEPGCHHGFMFPSLLRNLIYKRLAGGRRKKDEYVGISLHGQFFCCVFCLFVLMICECSMNQKQAPLQRKRAEIGVLLDTGQEDSAKGAKRC